MLPAALVKCATHEIQLTSMLRARRNAAVGHSPPRRPSDTERRVARGAPHSGRAGSQPTHAPTRATCQCERDRVLAAAPPQAATLSPIHSRVAVIRTGPNDARCAHKVTAAPSKSYQRGTHSMKCVRTLAQSHVVASVGCRASSRRLRGCAWLRGNSLHAASHAACRRSAGNATSQLTVLHCVRNTAPTLCRVRAVPARHTASITFLVCR
jgi:hypothetical protein